MGKRIERERAGGKEETKKEERSEEKEAKTRVSDLVSFPSSSTRQQDQNASKGVKNSPLNVSAVLTKSAQLKQASRITFPAATSATPLFSLLSTNVNQALSTLITASSTSLADSGALSSPRIKLNNGVAVFAFGGTPSCLMRAKVQNAFSSSSVLTQAWRTEA